MHYSWREQWRARMKPGEGILNIAKEVNASLIITGSRGQSKLRRTFLGSVSDYVMHRAPVPVLVCRKGNWSGQMQKKLYSFVFFKRNINRILWNVFINLSANILQVLLYTVCLVYVLCIMFFYFCLCTCIHTLFPILRLYLYTIKKRWVLFLYVTIKISLIKTSSIFPIIG